MALPTFVTSNKFKIQEMQEILGENAFSVCETKLDLPEIQGTCEEIAVDKCEKAFAILQQPVIVEDSELSIQALGGMPGPYIKHFVDSAGIDNIVKMLDAFDCKTAKATCVCAVKLWAAQKPITFIGSVHGRIVPAKGSRQFSWDPIFMPDGEVQTFAQLPPYVKNIISHRAKAFKAASAQLNIVRKATLDAMMD